MTVRYWNSCLESRHDDGFAEGLAEGEAKGLADGIALGEAKGKTGLSREIARNMLSRKIDMETIMTCTGLSKEVILWL